MPTTQAGKTTPPPPPLSPTPLPLPPSSSPAAAATTPATRPSDETFRAVKERLADKIGGLASAVLQVPASVHARTAPQAAAAAAPAAAQRDQRALARLGSAVHRALPAALQDLDRELDAALGRAEAVQRCLSLLEGTQARHEQRQRQRQQGGGQEAAPPPQQQQQQQQQQQPQTGERPPA